MNEKQLTKGEEEVQIAYDCYVTTPYTVAVCPDCDEEYGIPLYLLGEEKCQKCDKILEQKVYKFE